MALIKSILLALFILNINTLSFASNFSVSSYEIKGSLWSTGSVSFGGVSWSSTGVPGFKAGVRFANTIFLNPYTAHMSPLLFGIEIPVRGSESFKPKMGYNTIDPVLSVYLRAAHGRYSQSYSMDDDMKGWVVDPGITFIKRMDVLENVALGLSAGYRLFSNSQTDENQQQFYIESVITSNSPIGNKHPESFSFITLSGYVGYRFLPFIHEFNSNFGEDKNIIIDDNLVLATSAISMQNNTFSSSVLLSKPLNCDNVNIYFADLLFGYFLFKNSSLSIKPSAGVNFSWIESVNNSRIKHGLTSYIWPGISAGGNVRYKAVKFNRFTIAAETNVLFKYSKMPEKKAKNYYRQISDMSEIDLSGIELNAGLSLIF